MPAHFSNNEFEGNSSSGNFVLGFVTK